MWKWEASSPARPRSLIEVGIVAAVFGTKSMFECAGEAADVLATSGSDIWSCLRCIDEDEDTKRQKTYPDNGTALLQHSKMNVALRQLHEPLQLVFIDCKNNEGIHAIVKRSMGTTLES